MENRDSFIKVFWKLFACEIFWEFLEIKKKFVCFFTLFSINIESFEGFINRLVVEIIITHFYNYLFLFILFLL